MDGGKDGRERERNGEREKERGRNQVTYILGKRKRSLSFVNGRMTMTE